jgi:hypothetical protein
VVTTTPIVARYARSKGRAPSTPVLGEAGRSIATDSFGPTQLASQFSAVVTIWQGLLRALLLLLLPLLALAGEIDLHIATDQLAVGQTTTAEVQVRGAVPGGVPVFAASEGLQTRYVGQSQTMSIVNGRTERFVQFQYQVAALKEGRWTLGPAQVDLGDPRGGARQGSSNRVEITVGPPLKADGPDDRFQVDTSLTPEAVWQGQVVVLRYGWRARAQVVATEWLGLPQEGLVMVRDSQAERKEYAVDDPSGPIWVDETAVAVLPMQPGARSWDPPVARLDVEVDGPRRGPPGLLRSMFRQTERLTVAGDAMKIDVRPLPQAPADFSGLVGNFDVSSRLERRRARVGDSITWSIDVSGDGTTESFRAPSPPELDGARVYDEAPQARGALVKGAYLGAVTLHRTIVPTRVGSLELPPFHITVFSTTTGRYEELRVPGQVLEVAAGEAGDAGLTSFGEEPEEAAPEEDPNAPRPPRRSAGTSVASSAVWGAASLPFAGLALLPLLGAGVQTLRDRLRRREDAPREAGPEDLLAALPDAPEDRLRTLDAALRMAVARATGTPAATLDLRHIDLDDAPAVLELAQVLDLARFAGRAPPPDLADRVRALVARLPRRSAA